ncbi:MAG: 4Fe-4S dicluster-binding protein, partial [Candidatus Bathyarchaeota archaeon]
VMIQCVGSRNKKNPNCSRVCCTQAIKNSLKIKELSPETEVYILYKDIRTYGFFEEVYREAVSKGVICVRYDDETNIQTSQDDGKLNVSFWEPIIEMPMSIKPDLLVLSAATIANPDNEDLAKMLKVPLTKDKFFLEAHMKLRPVDFATEGIFVCGLAHSPKLIGESLAQASAAASRASTIISKKNIEVEGAIANVDQDLCSSCEVCLGLCEYNAIEMSDSDGKKRAHVLEALCKGCGVCGSACPTGAISMLHFTDAQIMAQIRSALEAV